MKRLLLTVSTILMLATTTANADPVWFTDRSFAVSNTSFYFQFQDGTLGASNMTRIAEDIIAIRNFGLKSEARMHSANGHDGYIYDFNMWNYPYFHGDVLKFPDSFDIVNSTNFLFIPQILSDAYTNSFVFLDSDTNMYQSAISFVNSLSPDNLDSIPSNQIWRIVYYRDATPSLYALARDEIVSDLKQQQYGIPSALSFYQTGPGTNRFPYAATWMRIPCLNWVDYAHENAFSCFTAVWYDGIWRLYPVEW